MGLDIVGTGGDRFGTVNVSTMASIVAAAAGVPVIKHGNRAASSASGSSDVLAALGVDLTLSPERVAEVLRETGITFAYASLFHPGFGHAGPTRRELGIPTVFNYLGPLCNPARPEASALGVAQLDKVPLFVGVFRTRGATALVFRGDDGLDELTTTGHSHIWEVSRGAVTEHDLNPAELGIPLVEISALLGGDPEFNAAIARTMLAGESGAGARHRAAQRRSGPRGVRPGARPGAGARAHRRPVREKTGGRRRGRRLRRRAGETRRVGRGDAAVEPVTDRQRRTYHTQAGLSNIG